MAAGGGVVRTICDIFEAEGFHVPTEAGDPPEAGIRRWYVEHFLSSADWTQPQTQAAFARAAAAAVEDWGHDWATPEALTADAVAFVKSARRDGIPLSEAGDLVAVGPGAAIPLARFAPLVEPHAAQEGLARIERNLDADPYVAIGSCKELVETVCQHVLDAYGVSYDRGESMLDLYKKTAEALGVHRDSVPDNAKASRTTKRILQNVASAVQGLTELRNEIGSGHGKTFQSAAQPRHARLALNATRTVVEFILDTWEHRSRSAARAAA